MTAAFGALVALNSALARLCTVMISALLGVIVLTMMLSVVMRYVFTSPLTWSDDLSLICLVWMTMLGLAAGMRAGHLAIEGVVGALPHTLARLVGVAVHGAVLLLAILVAYYGIAFVRQGMARIVPSMDWLRQGYIYAAIPAGFALTVPFCLEGILSPFLAPPDREAV